jgi:hypothetical protein
MRVLWAEEEIREEYFWGDERQNAEIGRTPVTAYARWHAEVEMSPLLEKPTVIVKAT